MGPRLISRGNEGRSQNFEAVEGASMGPRLISRGNAFAWEQATRPATASMGPRLISRGNGATHNFLIGFVLKSTFREVRVLASIL